MSYKGFFLFFVDLNQALRREKLATAKNGDVKATKKHSKMHQNKSPSPETKL